MQHQPDNRRRHVLRTRDEDGNEQLVHVKLPPGMRIDPVKATTEAKPQPAQADDPRSAFIRNVGGPYGPG
jgi:hypothetical protein